MKSTWETVLLEGVSVVPDLDFLKKKLKSKILKYACGGFVFTHVPDRFQIKFLSGNTVVS